MSTQGRASCPTAPHPHTPQGFHLNDRDASFLALLLRHMPRLATLRLDQLQLGSGALFTTLAANGQGRMLQELFLGRCAMVDDDGYDDLVQGVSRLQNLQVFELEGIEWESVESLDVSPLARLSRLERLHVPQMSCISTYLFGLDAVLSSCCLLRVLSLPGLAMLQPGSRSPSLEELNVNMCDFRYELDLPRMFPRLRAVGVCVLHLNAFTETRLLQSARWLASCPVPITFPKDYLLVPVWNQTEGDEAAVLAGMAPLVGWGPGLALKKLELHGRVSPAICTLLVRMFPNVQEVEVRHRFPRSRQEGVCLLSIATRFMQLQRLRCPLSLIHRETIVAVVVAACTHAQAVRTASDTPLQVVLEFAEGDAEEESQCRAYVQAWEGVCARLPRPHRSRVTVEQAVRQLA